MESISIKCPSGLVVSMREFKVSDENYLNSASKDARKSPVTGLLERLTVSIDDYGPYEKEGFSWDKVLQGDRLEAIRQVRIYTWGEHFEPMVVCPSCEKSVIGGYYSLKDFPVKELPEASLPHVHSGVPLRTKLPRCGKIVSFRLLRGEDENKLLALRKQRKDEMASALLRYQVIDIEGVPASGLNEFLMDLGSYDAEALRSSMQDADCGIVNEGTEFTCELCSHTWVGDLIMGGKGFLFPKVRKSNQTK